MKFRGCLVAAAVATVLALAGCTWSGDAPDLPGPTADEIATVNQARLDAYWEYSKLGDSRPRPEVAVVRSIGPDEWGVVMADCMNAAGFDTYRSSSGGGLSHAQPPPELIEADALAMYVCQGQYPFNEEIQGIYGSAQLEYLYDYYVRWLVPCLGWQGYDVGTVPARDTFLQSAFYPWNPYGAPALDDVPHGAPIERLQALCAPLPAGLLEQ